MIIISIGTVVFSRASSDRERESPLPGKHCQVKPTKKFTPQLTTPILFSQLGMIGILMILIDVCMDRPTNLQRSAKDVTGSSPGTIHNIISDETSNRDHVNDPGGSVEKSMILYPVSFVPASVSLFSHLIRPHNCRKGRYTTKNYLSLSFCNLPMSLSGNIDQVNELVFLYGQLVY